TTHLREIGRLGLWVVSVYPRKVPRLRRKPSSSHLITTRFTSCCNSPLARNSLSFPEPACLGRAWSSLKRSGSISSTWSLRCEETPVTDTFLLSEEKEIHFCWEEAPSACHCSSPLRFSSAKLYLLTGTKAERCQMAEPQNRSKPERSKMAMGCHIQKETCAQALFTIAKTWKEPKCPSMDKRIKKMWYIYTMEHYSAIKKDEILPFATTWMDLEGIMLSEISQTKSDTL
uniref:DUF1725 domain-containing protein n=1 Tax=Equus caballus TaxID=9796 RepID=A0A9L0RKF2_HORSE